MTATPILLPTHTDEGLTVPTALAAALMEFACDDPDRPHMSGLGLAECHLSATDGHTAARVLGCDPKGKVAPVKRDGTHWPREYVQIAIDVAKATKAPTITLEWGKATESAFSPLGRVWPEKYQIKSTVPIGVNARYIARSIKLAACVQARARFEKIPADPGGVIALAHAHGALDPLAFTIEGRDGRPNCEVLIMPVRL